MASPTDPPSTSESPAPLITSSTTQPNSRRGKYSGRGARDRYREDLANANASATATQEASSKLPQKRFFRQRAHANPFSDHQLE